MFETNLIVYGSLITSFILLVSSGLILDKTLNASDNQTLDENTDLKNSVYASFSVSLLVSLLFIIKIFLNVRKNLNYKDNSHLLTKNKFENKLFYLLFFISLGLLIPSILLFIETINSPQSKIKENTNFKNSSYALFSFSLVYFLVSLYLVYQNFKKPLSFTQKEICNQYEFEMNEDFKPI
jgi:hypothetical protein